MSVVAAVMTGPGLGAIATIQLHGATAGDLLRKIFRPQSDSAFDLEGGRILFGYMVDAGQRVDEVTIGCEGPDTFALHCHGNPLIIEAIVTVLRKQGVQVVPAEQLLARVLARGETGDAIALEAKLTLATVKTIEGAALMAHQVQGGLSQKIRAWQDRLDATPLGVIAAEAGDILEHSEPARLILSGCTIALVGPPNTGKSTLLNTLAGREKSIVSEIRGTTRDWVSAEIHLPPLAATIVDTAGLDPAMAASGGIDQAAQQKSLEIIQRADLILLVLDLSQPAEPLSESIAQQLAGRRIVTALNKADLPSCLDPVSIPERWGLAVRISAKHGTGLDDLIHAIHSICNVVDFDVRAPVAFTDRQRHLLEALQCDDSKEKARSIISELLDLPAWFGCEASPSRYNHLV